MVTPSKSNPIFGQGSVQFELPTAWPTGEIDPLLASQGFIASADLGTFSTGVCEVDLYRQADNHLHVITRIMTCSEVEAFRIPLDGLEYGPHTLDIRWVEDGVYLRLDRQPEIAIGWKQPDQAPSS